MNRILAVVLIVLATVAGSVAQGTHTGGGGGGGGSGNATSIQGQSVSSTPPGAGQCLVFTAGAWTPGSCAGSAATLNSVLAPTGNTSFATGAFTTTFNTSANSGTANVFTISDLSTNTGTGYLFNVTSGTSSTAKPFRACYRGTTDCVNMDTTLLTTSGAALIDATKLTGALPAISGASLTNITFAQLTSKPTTLGGFGITDAVQTNSNATLATLVLTPGSDVVTLAAKRNSSAQTSFIQEWRTEANARLSGVDKTGAFIGPTAQFTGITGLTQCLQVDSTGAVTGAGFACGAAGGAPAVATYILQTSNAALTNAQVLASLATGLVKNTTGTGVLSIAVAGTDYAAPTSGSAPLKGNGAGGFSAVVASDIYGLWTGSCDATKALWGDGSCKATIQGTAASGQISFGSGSAAITSSSNLTYSASSGISQIGGANNVDLWYAKRFTDTTPTGNLIHFQNAAATQDLFKVDIAGNLTSVSSTTSNPSGNAGMISMVQGTAPTDVTNAVNLLAPSSVTTYHIKFPSAVAAGFWNQDSSGNLSFGTLSGDVSSSALAVTVAKVNGVAYAAGPSVDTAPIITAANTATYTAINNCGDSTHALSYNTTTHAFGCQAITASASAGGSTTQVQFNNAGALSGSANLTWVSPVLTIGAAGVTGQLSLAGLTSGTTAIQASSTASGVLTLPAYTATILGSTGSLTNGNILKFDSSGRAVDGAIAAANLPTMASVGVSGNLVQSAGNDRTQSDSGIATANVATMGSNGVSGNLIQAAGNNKTQSDSGIATANVVQATANAGAAKQIAIAAGANKSLSYIDFPDVKIVPAANCNAGTAGAGWSLPSTNAPTAACRAGTNNLGGVLQWANNNTTTNSQFTFELPADWDTASQPFISIYYSSGANTTGTVKWTFSTACTKGDGSVSDDGAFNAETATTGNTMAAANRMWRDTLQLTAVTSGNSCVPGSSVIVKVTSGNGTATSSVNVDKVVVTVPRLLTVQAN